MFDLVAKRTWFLIGSALLAVVCVVLVVVPGGLKYGIDFKAGISITLASKEGETLTLDQVQNKLAELGQGQASIQELGGGGFFIRIGELSLDEQTALRSGLEQIATVDDFESVSAVVATKTARNAAIAMGVATLAMLVYIALAFRKVQNPLRYGVAAVIALIFNILVTVGLYSFMGRIMNWEIDPMFISAILAIIGYSVNDSIVVLDRIRENVTRGVTPDFSRTVNFSLVQTLTRSLNTGMAALLTIIVVYLFVGGPISHFLVALFVGIVAGTFSSIFIASQLLIVWERGEWGSLIPSIRRRKAVEG